MAKRDRNSETNNASRAETMEGTIRDLITMASQDRKPTTMKDASKRRKCQGFQKVQVFGKDRLLHRDDAFAGWAWTCRP